MFYHCYGSAHSSVVAASIHLGLLPSDRIPTAEEFVKLPLYDKTDSYKIGYPFYIGTDNKGIDVFVIGMLNQEKIVVNALNSILTEYGLDPKLCLMVETLKLVNITTRVGGFLSRRLKLVSVGRPLTIYGIQKNYKKFIYLVEKVKAKLDNIL
ncbi:MAG: hypothetical protein PWQ82_677 [Thermosediminibacterales bacterium]|nr:hypothetical protein [Thermosediminibacterales bacterium]